MIGLIIFLVFIFFAFLLFDAFSNPNFKKNSDEKENGKRHNDKLPKFLRKIIH